MTNRTEIQAGMVDYIRLVGNKPEVYTPEMCSEDLMEYLHSQGVVIKVDRKLPNLCKFEQKQLREIVDHSGNSGIRHDYNIRIAHTEGVQHKMLSEGYVAVEPLIDEIR